MEALATIWRMLEHLCDRVTSVLTAVAFTASFAAAVWQMGRWAKPRWYRWLMVPPGAVVVFVLMGWWWTIVLPDMFGYERFWTPRPVSTGQAKGEVAEVDHFLASLQYAKAAAELSNQVLDRGVGSSASTGIVSIKPEEQQEITKLVQESLTEAQGVNDGTLSKLQPELPDHFREEFCEGNRLLLRGLQEGDAVAQLKGQRLLVRWVIWYESHRSVVNKALSPRA